MDVASLHLPFFNSNSFSLLLHAADDADGAVEQAEDERADKEENGEIKEDRAYGGASIVVILAVAPRVALPALAHTVHAHAPALALANALLYFVA